MAPLNVSKMFENKMSPPEISTILAEKLALPGLSEDLGTNTLAIDVQTLPNLSLLSLCLSKILGIPDGLCNAIVKTLPLAVTNILARRILPSLQLEPDTRPFDVRRLFLKDVLPSANVARLFENSPSAWLEAKRKPRKVWQVVSQIGQIVENPTFLLKLPPWLLFSLLPVFPMVGPLLFGLKLLAIWVRFALTTARLLLTWTIFRKACALLVFATKICVVATKVWQVYGLKASITYRSCTKINSNDNSLGYFSGTQSMRQFSNALHPSQISTMTPRGYASHICSFGKWQLRI